MIRFKMKNPQSPKAKGNSLLGPVTFTSPSETVRKCSEREPEPAQKTRPARASARAQWILAIWGFVRTAAGVFRVKPSPQKTLGKGDVKISVDGEVCQRHCCNANVQETTPGRPEETAWPWSATFPTISSDEIGPRSRKSFDFLQDLQGISPLLPGPQAGALCRDFPILHLDRSCLALIEQSDIQGDVLQ
jgi:hypothetical protein